MATKTSVDYVATQIAKMASQGATEAEIDIYLAGKGFNSRDQYLKRLKRFRDRKEQAGDIDVDFGFFDSVLQGLTLGFSDEIGSAIAAGGVSGPEYERQMAARKFAREDFEEENPGMALTGEILGGLAPGLLTGGAGLALAGGKTALRQGGKMGLGRLIGTEAAVGAGTGAVAGAGTADPGERGAGAGLGAGIGGTLGVALPAIGAGVKGAVGGARRGLGMMTRNEAEEAAKRKLSGALARDQVTPQEIIEQIPEGPGFGPIDESVADLAGENVLGVARASQAIPGRSKDMGREALVERAEGQYDRVSDYLLQATGRPKEDVFQVVDEIVARREAEASPLFEEAFQMGVVKNDRLDEILQKPYFSSAAEGKAQTIAKLADVDLGDPDVGYDMRTLHFIKMSIDDKIGDAVPGSGIGRTERRELVKAKNEFVDILKDINEPYGKALDVYAGESALLDAIESGRNFWKKDPRLTEREIAKLTKSEKDMFLAGALDSIRSLMDRAADSRDLVKVIFGNRQFRDKIRAVVKDEDAFERLKFQMEREANAKRTQDVVLGGSPTARIQAEMTDLNEAPSILADLLLPTQESLTQRVARRTVQPVARKAQELTQGRVTDAMAPMLFDMRPEVQRRTMRELIDFQNQMQERLGRGRGRMIYGAGVSGALPGLLMTNPN
jgi:hypothetical protein